MGYLSLPPLGVKCHTHSVEAKQTQRQVQVTDDDEKDPEEVYLADICHQPG